MGCEWIGFCSLKAEAQAAWTQAVLSVLAILVAIAIPIYQRWIDRRRDADSLMSLAQQVMMKAMDLRKSVEDYSGRRTLAEWATQSDWSELRDAIRSIEISRLPSPEFLGPLIELREVAAQYTEKYQKLIELVSKTDELQAEEEELLDGYGYRAENMWNSFVDARKSVWLGAGAWKKVVHFTDGVADGDF